MEIILPHKRYRMYAGEECLNAYECLKITNGYLSYFDKLINFYVINCRNKYWLSIHPQISF